MIYLLKIFHVLMKYEIILLKNGKVKEIKVSDEKLKEISDLIQFWCF